MLRKIIAAAAALLNLLMSPFLGTAEPPEVSEPVREQSPAVMRIRTAEEVNGADGMRFYICRPEPLALKNVNASDFGLSEKAEDNFPAFSAALNYCAENPGTRLVIDSGVYRFTTHGTLLMNGLKDVIIDGGGALFLFSNEGEMFSIGESKCVEICNLRLDWDWEKSRLGDVVEIKNADRSGNTAELVFVETGLADETAPLMALTQMDKETYTFGAKESGKESYLYQTPGVIKSVVKTAADTLKITHDGSLDYLEDGEVYMLRHYVYGSTLFHLGGGSRDITFDSVDFMGSPGMAVKANDNASHFQILNSYVGVDPEHRNDRHVSMTADAFHLVNTDGCFKISGCDVSGMGDDAVNVHDGLGYVESVSGDTLTLIASAMRLKNGDRLSFKNKAFENTGTTAVIKNVRNLEGIKQEVTLERSVGGEVEPGFTAFSLECNSGNYVISDNYFHENRARGLLLQSSHGLCENNRFYKIQGMAIRVIMDIVPTLWQEGTGVNGLVIRNNEFDSCDYSAWGSVIEVGTSIDGRRAETFVFDNISITGNSFSNISRRLLSADNANGLTFADNTVKIGTLFKKTAKSGTVYLGRYCANLSIGGNEWTDAGAFSTAPVIKAETLPLWIKANLA